MAEIKVEPKRGGLGWLWAIILIALLAVAAWYFLTRTGAPAATTPADSVRTSMIDVPMIELPMIESPVIESPVIAATEDVTHG